MTTAPTVTNATHLNDSIAKPQSQQPMTQEILPQPLIMTFKPHPTLKKTQNVTLTTTLLTTQPPTTAPPPATTLIYNAFTYNTASDNSTENAINNTTFSNSNVNNVINNNVKTHNN